MQKYNAIREIGGIFSLYMYMRSQHDVQLAKLTQGKLYELYCLSQLFDSLTNDYGYGINFKGPGKTLNFRTGKQQIDRRKQHFEVLTTGRGQQNFDIFTNVEFRTLGSSRNKTNDRSAHHEIDIVVVKKTAKGKPERDQIVLGIECKSTANFGKSIVKEVLGIRREMCLLTALYPSYLSAPSRKVNFNISADPPSEYWLAYLHDKGDNYKESPKVFGIQFCHWQP